MARKLNDTSWLAQVIKDKMEVEFDKNRASIRYRCLQTLHILINEADGKENANVRYETLGNKRAIVICNIPSLMKYGTDFDTYGMQCKLRGLAERYKDDDGQYIVDVLTTHDLSSATIKDLGELLYQMNV